MESKNMSGAKRVTAKEGEEPKPTPKRLRNGTACAHCLVRAHHTAICIVCGEKVCSAPQCGGFVICSASGCTARVSCKRLLPSVDVGARKCGCVDGEIYCRAHRDLIRSQCQRCCGFLCEAAFAAGDRFCYICRTAPAVDKDDNNA